MNARDELAEILYVEDHWHKEITEHDLNRLSDDVYRERASRRWRAGQAGWAHHERYPKRADLILAAGYGKPQVLGYVVVDRGGTFVGNQHKHRESAQALADEWTADAKKSDLDWDYRVAEIVEAAA